MFVRKEETPTLALSGFARITTSLDHRRRTAKTQDGKPVGSDAAGSRDRGER